MDQVNSLSLVDVYFILWMLIGVIFSDWLIISRLKDANPVIKFYVAAMIAVVWTVPFFLVITIIKIFFMTTIQIALIVISQFLAALNVALLIYITYKIYSLGKAAIPFLKSHTNSDFKIGADGKISFEKEMDCIDGLQAFLEARLVYEFNSATVKNFETLERAMASILYEVNSLDIVTGAGIFLLLENKSKTNFNDVEFSTPIISFRKKKSFTDNAFGSERNRSRN